MEKNFSTGVRQVFGARPRFDSWTIGTVMYTSGLIAVFRDSGPTVFTITTLLTFGILYLLEQYVSIGQTEDIKLTEASVEYIAENSSWSESELRRILSDIEGIDVELTFPVKRRR